MTAQVYYLSYISTMKMRAWLRPHTVADIVKNAQDSNQANSITGFLCYGSRCFFQFIEGTKEAIEALFEKLKKDHRHHKVTLMSQGYADTRRFADWAMYSMTFDNLLAYNRQAQSFNPFRPYDWAESHNDEFLDFVDGHYHNRNNPPHSSNHKGVNQAFHPRSRLPHLPKPS